jgi:DTW domain-containing protein
MSGNSVPVFQNAFHRLRERCLAEATREFKARGKSVQRCEGCLLASYNCICTYRPSRSTRVEFVLVMHKNETFKPTNTGRLIADLFPAHTHAFRWTRTQPDAGLVELLQDPQRQCLLVFPAEASESKPRQVLAEIPPGEKTPTFILLDGTWKQSGRMFHLSRWLEQVPCIVLPQAGARGYAVRKSHQDNYLSTAEAAALCLQLAGERANSETLLDYFELFNEHYVATRGCYPVIPGELHKKLLADLT